MSHFIKHVIQAHQPLVVAQHHQLILPHRAFTVEDLSPRTAAEASSTIPEEPLALSCASYEEYRASLSENVRPMSKAYWCFLRKEYSYTQEPTAEQIQEVIALQQEEDADEADQFSDATNDTDDRDDLPDDLLWKQCAASVNADAPRAREIARTSKTHAETLNRLVAEVRRGNAAAIEELASEVYAQGEEPAVNSPAAVGDLVRRATELANDPLNRVDWSLKPAGKNSIEWACEQGFVDPGHF